MCTWTVVGSAAGINLTTITVRERFDYRPFSDLDNYDANPSITNELTPEGSVLYSTGASNGFTLPREYLNPDAIVQLWVSAHASLEWPRSPSPTLIRLNEDLSGYVNSPAYSSSPCEGEFHLHKEVFGAGPIGDAVEGIINVSTWLCRVSWGFGC
jgi:hypothetical protein